MLFMLNSCGTVRRIGLCADERGVSCKTTLVSHHICGQLGLPPWPPSDVVADRIPQGLKTVARFSCLVDVVVVRSVDNCLCLELLRQGRDAMGGRLTKSQCRRVGG